MIHYILCARYICMPSFKKSLAISRGKSEAVNRRRTDNTMATRKWKKANNDLQNTPLKANDQLHDSHEKPRLVGVNSCA